MQIIVGLISDMLIFDMLISEMALILIKLKLQVKINSPFVPCSPDSMCFRKIHKVFDRA